MKDFRKNGQSSDRNGGFGNRDNRDNRGGYNKFNHGNHENSSRGDVMHKAVCSECGKTCEVPFVPSGNKPVYCSDCFTKKKEGQSNRFEKRDFAPRPSHEHPHQDQPRPQAPQRDYRIDELKAQMDSLNSKLDRVIRMVEGFASTPRPVEKPQEVSKAEVAQKKVKSMKLEKALKTMPVAKKVVVKLAAKAKTVTKKKK